MTAFARVQQANEAGSITWELRSVNHRYLEPGIKLPDEFRQLEPEIRKLLGKYLTRGNKLSVSDILSWPGVISEGERDISALLTLSTVCLDAALAQLQESREAEGRALEEMIRSRCQQVSDIVAEVRKQRPEMVASLRAKWTAALDEKLAQWRDSANENRLEQELVMLAQKLDVEEELDRLDTHIAEVLNVLDRDEAVGRRLDFLMQELNREANTLGSKSQDGATTQQAVDLKVLIEQMREQVQNIE